MEESVKQTVLLIVQALFLTVLVASVAFAGGYQINEMGARATGMGGAFVAQASDPSAVYYNPAGLASQKGINALVGLDLIIPSTELKPASGASAISTESQVFLPLNLYGTYQLDDQTVVGLGIFNPFGLGAKWPSAAPTYALDASMQAFYFNPAVGYKIDDEFSVGLGVSLVYVSIADKYTGVSIEGTGTGFNLNIGGTYKPMEDLCIGLSYRIPTEVEVSGDVTITGLPKATGKAKIPMPGNLQLGVSYQVMPELLVEGDVQYVQWSAYKGIDFTINGVTTDDPSKWDDAAILRAGAEYKLDEEITLRAGLILDLSPQPPSQTTLVLPDSYRSDVSIGGSYKVDENLSIHAAYMLVLFGERDAKMVANDPPMTIPGTYNTTAHVLSVNVSYAF
jgi:long-chain fatty acid transport protein